MPALSPDESATTTAGSLACDPKLEAALAGVGTRFKVRRGQKLPERQGDDAVHYFVCDGALYLQSELPGRRRAIVATYYPGDLCSTLMVGSGRGEDLLVAESGTVVRVRADMLSELCISLPMMSHEYVRWMQVRAVRVEAHAIVVGRLTGEERVAAYLIETGLMRGENRDKAVHVELPFSRDEVADYLALNPDSLSRFLSRLKSEGVVTLLGHRRAIIADWDELLRRCPLAETLRAVFQR